MVPLPQVQRNGSSGFRYPNLGLPFVLVADICRITLKGGSKCDTNSTCALRYEQTPTLMSSSGSLANMFSQVIIFPRLNTHKSCLNIFQYPDKLLIHEQPSAKSRFLGFQRGLRCILLERPMDRHHSKFFRWGMVVSRQQSLASNGG